MFTSLSDPTHQAEAGSVVVSDRELSLEEVALLDAVSETQQPEGAMGAAGTQAGPGPLPIPIPIPFPLPMRAVSGRYRGTSGSFQLELRVDVDRVNPMKKVSGDFYQVSGATTTYFGSFVVNSPTITVAPTTVDYSRPGAVHILRGSASGEHYYSPPEYPATASGGDAGFQDNGRRYGRHVRLHI